MYSQPKVVQVQTVFLEADVRFALELERELDAKHDLKMRHKCIFHVKLDEVWRVRCFESLPEDPLFLFPRISGVLQSYKDHKNLKSIDVAGFCNNKLQTVASVGSG